ncbi:MAG: hypothetical protein V4819_07475 [Verrucomicrobiota bacterium]
MDAPSDNAARIVTVLQEFGFPPDAVSTETITGRKKIIRMGFEPMSFPALISVDATNDVTL